MADFVPLWNDNGVDTRFRLNSDGTADFAISQDLGAVLDRNKAMANHNDGFNATRDMKRIAHVPPVLEIQWREEGWYPHDKVELARRLNSSDWAHLRTADGHLGVSNGVMR